MSSDESKNLVQEEHLDTQRKTFSKWINSQLSVDPKNRDVTRVTDLFYDLRDGLILTQVLENLSKQKIKREKGSLRVHKLSNVSHIINFLRDQQVKLVNINNVDIVDGNAKITLALIWSIILHWQFNKVLTNELQHVSNLEKSLLAWCRQSTINYAHLDVNIVDFSASWKDGKAFAALLHNFHPSKFEFEVILSQKRDNPPKLLEYVFNLNESLLKVPKLLDPEDLAVSRPDKKSVMTYVMCLFQVLPHENIDMAYSRDIAIHSEVGMKPNQFIATPLRSPFNKGQPLTYKSFCEVHEEVLEWLLDVEDKLKDMPPVPEDLPHVRDQFHAYRSFLFDVESQDKVLGHVREEGQKLTNSGLKSHQVKDINVRLKLLFNRWNDFRTEALKRQHEIDVKLMELQRNELKSIRDWMTTAEDKISRIGTVGTSLDEVQAHIRDHEELQIEFEKREALITKFILITGKEEDKGEASSSEEQDFEGHLMAIEERWFVLCSWIESRREKLWLIGRNWREFNDSRFEMSEWLDEVGKRLKMMEQSPTEEKEELQAQADDIKKIEDEIHIRREMLRKIEKVADDLLKILEADPTSSEEINRSLEVVQDRWEILTEVMDAQRQRLTSLGFSLRRSSSRSPSRHQPAPPTPSKNDTNNDKTNRSQGENKTPNKKRKITSSKRIEFESNFAATSHWLSSIQEKSFPLPNDEVVLQKIIQEIEENFDNMCSDLLKLGEDLIREIKSEQDFPPDYLSNVTEKINSLKCEVEKVDLNKEKLKSWLQFLNGKQQFYSECQNVKETLSRAEKWIDSGLNVTSQSNISDFERSLERLAEWKSVLSSCEEEVTKLKSMSGDLSLHPGAINDPSNTIKSDVYQICDTWRAIDTMLGDKETDILRWKRDVEENCQGNQTDVSMFSSYECSFSSSHDDTSDKEILHLLQVPIQIENRDKLESEVATLRRYLTQGLPRHEIKCKVEKRVASIETLLQQLTQFGSELDGMTMYMDRSDEALAKVTAELVNGNDGLSDAENQLREVNSYVDEMASLKPNLTIIHNTAKALRVKASQEFVSFYLDKRLRQVNDRYEATVAALREKANVLNGRLTESRKWSEAIADLDSFLDSLVQSSPSEKPVTQPIEMSQRNYKLLQLKDRIEKKRRVFDKLVVNSKQKSGGDELPEPIRNLKQRWESVTKTINERYSRLKNASNDYGEFKTLSAQESDWLERLEKKLRKSAITAADAEEISEEHDDIENFLKNHPNDRLSRLEAISQSLNDNNVLIASVNHDSKRLNERWKELNDKATKRLALLEGSITEAQEWEYRLMDVQGWLTEKDILLTSHLEQELTVDDLPDEAQEMLREFEDKEYLLSEMDEQVELYREDGKIEAAARLEDQLLLIHDKYQELLMKFELFQQQPAVEYEPRLARIHRQLRDIREKLFLTELNSAEVHSINSQVHQAHCIYNALSDIKPEVENVIKMGRKLVENGAVEHPVDLTMKIDSLKEDFNQVGVKITDARNALEFALNLAQQLEGQMETLQTWLVNTDSDLSNASNLSQQDCEKFLAKTFSEAGKMREILKSILKIRDELLGLGYPSSLGTLSPVLRGLESRWGKVMTRLTKKVSSLKKDDEGKPLTAGGPLSNVRFESLLIVPEHQVDNKKTSDSRTPHPQYVRDDERMKELMNWLVNSKDRLQDVVRSRTDVEAMRTELALREKTLKDLNSLLNSSNSETMDDINRMWQVLNDKLIEASAEKVSNAKDLALDSHDEDEDIIDTLPEENQSPLKRKLPAELDISAADWKKSKEGKEEIKPLSSRESSPEMEILSEQKTFQAESAISKALKVKDDGKYEIDEEIQAALPIRSPTTTSPPPTKPPQSSKKSPPKTLPKPQWFSLDQAEMNPVPDLLSVTSNIPGHLTEDELLAKENFAIERILQETDSELAEVRKSAGIYRKKSFNSQHQKDIKDFEDNVVTMLAKIEAGHSKITQVEKQRNISLKQELITMEVSMIEAEAKTLISRGETLAMLVDRSDHVQAELLRAKVESLKNAWQSLKSSADKKIEQNKKFENDIKLFRSDVEDFKNWLRDISSQLKRKRSNINYDDLATEMRKRSIELVHLREKAALFKKKEMLGTQDIAVTMISTQFRDLQELVLSQLGPEQSQMFAQPDVPPSDNIYKNENAAEIVARITKMREAVLAIDRQMNTQILANKKYERLEEQNQALKIVQQALEKLRPTIKKTAKDLEALTGSLSVEYLEKIVSLSEKLRDEWHQVNQRYSKRQVLWISAKEKHESFFNQLRDLDLWLDKAEKIMANEEKLAKNQSSSFAASEEHVQLERQVSEKNKAVTNTAILGKEIMSDTSAQEYVELQTSIDNLLKRWKAILSKLAAERNRLNKEKYQNNLNFINRWIDSNLQKVSRPVNSSSSSDMRDMLSLLQKYDTELLERNRQVDKLCNASNMLTSDVIQNLRNSYTHIVKLIPTTKVEIEKMLNTLNDLFKRLKSLEIWIRDVALRLDNIKRHPNTQAFMDVKNLIESKEPEMSEVRNVFQSVAQDVSHKNLELDDNLQRLMIDVDTQWVCLNSDCIQNLSRHQLNQKTTKFAPEKEETPPSATKETNKMPSPPPNQLDHLAPQVFASLRDHRDWIRRKRIQLSALTLGGDVKSLEKQAEDHQEFRNELKQRRIPISEDIRHAKDLSNEEIDDCVKNLQQEWSELCDITEMWQNKVENMLANTKMFEMQLENLYERLANTEELHKQISLTRVPGRPLDHEGYEQYQALSTQICSLDENLTDLRNQAERLSLSPTTVIELDKLDARLKALKETVNEEQMRKLSSSVSTQIEAANNAEDDRFNVPLPCGWERGLNEDKIPYFMNHEEEKTQWNHPLFSELMNSLLNVNTVKYSAYRLALKLRKVQQRLCLDLLDIDAAVFGFEEHGMTSKKHDMAISVPDMILVLSSIYEALHEEEPSEVDVPLCIDLCLNWLLNVYDSDRQGQIRVLSFKIGVLLLCRGPLTEKYLHLFKLVSFDKKLAQRPLGLLLHDTIQIPKALGEVASFGGSNIEPSVRSCFSLNIKRSEDPSPQFIDAKQFLKWLKQEPQCLVWLPVLHRLASAEVAKHNAKCKVCKMYPIVGFRYHCTKCFNFDLCHNCFFVCKTAKGHKQEHPMQEYCTPTGTSVNLKNLGQAFRNSFRSKKYFQKKQKKLGYLPVNSVLEGEDYTSPTLSPNLSLESRELNSSNMGSLQPKVVNPDEVEELSNGHVHEDEHSVIAQYCQMLNSDEATDNDYEDTNRSPNSSLMHQFSIDRKDDLQRIMQTLEKENRELLHEYESLRRQRNGADTPGSTSLNGDVEHDLKREAKHLKVHSQRMETRMKILEDHNEKLMEQINRFKTLLANGEAIPENVVIRRGENFGTLNSKSVRASDLYYDETTASSNDDTMERKGRKYVKHKSESHANIDIDSLDLSDHETQRICD